MPVIAMPYLLWFHTGEQGFEPRPTDPESAVLPLDDSPSYGNYFSIIAGEEQIIGQSLFLKIYGALAHPPARD